MKRFVEGEDRLQGALLPHYLDDYVTENNPVRNLPCCRKRRLVSQNVLSVLSKVKGL
jgi:hypothetical protein